MVSNQQIAAAMERQEQALNSKHSTYVTHAAEATRKNLQARLEFGSENDRFRRIREGFRNFQRFKRGLELDGADVSNLPSDAEYVQAHLNPELKAAKSSTSYSAAPAASQGAKPEEEAPKKVASARNGYQAAPRDEELPQTEENRRALPADKTVQGPSAAGFVAGALKWMFGGVASAFSAIASLFAGKKDATPSAAEVAPAVPETSAPVSADSPPPTSETELGGLTPANTGTRVASIERSTSNTI